MTTLTKDQESLAESLNESVIEKMAEVAGLSVAKIEWLIQTNKEVNAFFKETRSRALKALLVELDKGVAS
jgi:hypothetical protein